MKFHATRSLMSRNKNKEASYDCRKLNEMVLVDILINFIGKSLNLYIPAHVLMAFISTQN